MHMITMPQKLTCPYSRVYQLDNLKTSLIDARGAVDILNAARSNAPSHMHAEAPFCLAWQ